MSGEPQTRCQLTGGAVLAVRPKPKPATGQGQQLLDKLSSDSSTAMRWVHREFTAGPFNLIGGVEMGVSHEVAVVFTDEYVDGVLVATLGYVQPHVLTQGPHAVGFGNRTKQIL